VIVCLVSSSSNSDAFTLKFLFVLSLTILLIEDEPPDLDGFGLRGDFGLGYFDVDPFFLFLTLSSFLSWIDGDVSSDFSSRVFLIADLIRLFLIGLISIV